jgi:hypothetical protein
MLTLGYRIEYEPHAVAHTKAPATLAGLINQRYRWNRGTMQVVLWYLKRTLRGGKSPLKVKAWIAAVFLLDFSFFPPLYFVLLGSSLLYVFHGGQSFEPRFVGHGCMSAQHDVRKSLRRRTSGSNLSLSALAALRFLSEHSFELCLVYRHGRPSQRDRNAMVRTRPLSSGTTNTLARTITAMGNLHAS